MKPVQPGVARALGLVPALPKTPPTAKLYSSSTPQQLPAATSLSSSFEMQQSPKKGPIGVENLLERLAREQSLSSATGTMKTASLATTPMAVWPHGSLQGRGSWSGSMTDDGDIWEESSEYHDSDFASVSSNDDDDDEDELAEPDTTAWEGGASEDVEGWLRSNLPPPAAHWVRDALGEAPLVSVGDESDSAAPSCAVRQNLHDRLHREAEQRRESLVRRQRSCDARRRRDSFVGGWLNDQSRRLAAKHSGDPGYWHSQLIGSRLWEAVQRDSAESILTDSITGQVLFSPRINSKSRALAAAKRRNAPPGEATDILYEQSNALRERQQTRKEMLEREALRISSASFVTEGSVRILGRRLRKEVAKIFRPYDVHGVGAVQSSGLERILVHMGILGDRTPSRDWAHILQTVWDRLVVEVDMPLEYSIATPCVMLGVRLKPLVQLLIRSLVTHDKKDELTSTIRHWYVQNCMTLEGLVCNAEDRMYKKEIDGQEATGSGGQGKKVVGPLEVEAMWKRVQADSLERKQRLEWQQSRQLALQDRDHTFTPRTNSTSSEIVSRRASRANATQAFRTSKLMREVLRDQKDRSRPAPITSEEREVREHCTFSPTIDGFIRGPPVGSSADVTLARRQTWEGSLERGRKARLRRLALIELRHRMALRPTPFPSCVLEMFHAEGVPVPQLTPATGAGKGQAHTKMSKQRRSELITLGCRRAAARSALTKALEEGGDMPSIVFIIEIFDGEGKKKKSLPLAVSGRKQVHQAAKALKDGYDLSNSTIKALAVTMGKELAAVSVQAHGGPCNLPLVVIRITSSESDDSSPPPPPPLG